MVAGLFKVHCPSVGVLRGFRTFKSGWLCPSAFIGQFLSQQLFCDAPASLTTLPSFIHASARPKKMG
jgi:hypothetical protein